MIKLMYLLNLKGDSMSDKTKGKNTAFVSLNQKRKSSVMRIVFLVVLLCVVVFGAVIISDFVSRNGDGKDSAQKAEYVTIRVSGKVVYLDGEVVTLEELSDFFAEQKQNSQIPETAFITDTSNPADAEVYNQVLSLLSGFDINVNVERMIVPSSADEMSASTNDEEIR